MMMTAAVWAAAPPELRGVWVDRAPLASRESIAAMMENLKEAHFNAVFVDVWSRGYPLWQSAVFERHTGLKTDPVYGERDVLAEAIEEGKARGLAVIPWVEYGFVIGYSGGRAPMVEAHPDWLAKRKDGTADFSWAGTTKSYWMAHSHPEAQRFLLELMLELGGTYDVPAIQFDRARYPEKNCGYDEATKALYAAGHDGAAPPDDENNAEWGQWRAEQMNGFVAELHRSLKAANWRMLVTNAPAVFDYSYRLFLQDYPAWMRAGSLDFVSPQVYRPDLGAFERELDNQLKHLGGEGARMAPGVDISNTNAETLVRSIEICRERKLAGVVVWYYGSLVQKGALGRLRETVYSEPAALPWR
jgi:uncharacterized lipoprotein YddW (UPF0748 family)